MENYSDLIQREILYMYLEYPGWERYKEKMARVLEKAKKPMTIQEAYHKVAKP